jgi:osmoprotectant transport system permease protein
VSWLRYLDQNGQQILQWLWFHTWLSVVPVVLGLAVSLPLGWVARRFRWTYAPLVTLSGLLYTIPSIALFVILPGILGLGILDPLNVAVALTLYTVALLVRVVADGLASVPDDVTQAASAMGYRPLQRLLAVELPIAVPVIAAGLRVAVVSNVSLVAVAATIGVPELGQLFTIGFQLAYFVPIVIGIIMCVALAMVLDLVVVALTRWLTPWTRAVVAP